MKDFVQIALLVIISGLQLAFFLGRKGGQTDTTEASLRADVDRLTREFAEFRSRNHKLADEVTKMPSNLRSEFVTRELWQEFRGQYTQDQHRLSGELAQLWTELKGERR